MGSILSFFNRSTTSNRTYNKLTTLQDTIFKLQKKRLDVKNAQSTTEKRLKYTACGFTLMYAILAFKILPSLLIGWIDTDYWTDFILLWLPCIIVPFLYFQCRKLIVKWYTWRLKSWQCKLTKKRDEKNTILDHVSETETYQNAINIFQKFDPIRLKNITKIRDSVKSTSNSSNSSKVASNVIFSSNTDSKTASLRQRNVYKEQTSLNNNKSSTPVSKKHTEKSTFVTPAVPSLNANDLKEITRKQGIKIHTTPRKFNSESPRKDPPTPKLKALQDKQENLPNGTHTQNDLEISTKLSLDQARLQIEQLQKELQFSKKELQDKNDKLQIIEQEKANRLTVSGKIAKDKSQSTNSTNSRADIISLAKRQRAKEDRRVNKSMNSVVVGDNIVRQIPKLNKASNCTRTELPSSSSADSLLVNTNVVVTDDDAILSEDDTAAIQHDITTPLST